MISPTTAELLHILKSMPICSEEFNYRLGRLKVAEKKKGSAINTISDAYYTLAHEIMCFPFLSLFGNIRVSEDHNGEAGCDYLLNDKYQIECVCSTPGTTDNGMKELCQHDGKLFDYGKKQEILYTRLTSSIRSKLQFYQGHISNGTLHPDKPYIIFLGLGALATEMFCESEGFAFLGFLLGKGNPTLSINAKTGKLQNTGYSFRQWIHNHNNAEIDANIFCAKDYQCISGVIISSAVLGETYTPENTWLFINPFAKQKIVKKDFWGIHYWAVNKDMSYSAKCKGRSL